MAAIRSSLLLLLPVLLAACQQDSEAKSVRRESACSERTFEGARFTACRYEAGRDEILLALADSRGPLRSFARLKAALGPRARRVGFAMNAGMFDAAGRPVGLYVEDGIEKHAINRRTGPGNFHMQPNGVLAVGTDGRVMIVPSPAWPPPRSPVRWATQSGPMLVIAGRLHPLIQPDGASRYVRNAVGVADARTAWFVITDEPVSFGRLARFLRDGLGCRDALYFDGAVSSLWDPANGREDERQDLGPLVAVLRKLP
jgi:uncharacterized protein YigE (DUF2233 family)